MSTALPLAGRRIVLTRPAGQNEPLAERIVELGGEPILYPVLTIGEVVDPQQLAEATAQLERYDLAVFVSPNAVERALDYILARRAWPADLPAATVGPGSAAALRQRGVRNVITPTRRFDSEHLLELLPTDMTGRHVVVFRGQDGRPLLGETLRARGASVDFVPCYTRMRPVPDPAAWGDAPVDAVVVTSSEGFRNLHAMLDESDRKRLAGTQIFVPHARIADVARSFGFERLTVTPPGDDGLLSALAGFWDKVRDGAA